MVIIQYINKLKYAFIFYIHNIVMYFLDFFRDTYWFRFVYGKHHKIYISNSTTFFVDKPISFTYFQFALFLFQFLQFFLLQPIAFGMVIVENNIKQIDISNYFQCVIQPAQQLSHFLLRSSPRACLLRLLLQLCVCVYMCVCISLQYSFKTRKFVCHIVTAAIVYVVRSVSSHKYFSCLLLTFVSRFVCLLLFIYSNKDTIQ